MVDRRSTEPSPAALELYHSLPIASRHRRPGLRVAARVRGPVLIGFVPADDPDPPLLDRPEASESLRMALLHELAHMEESDPWFGLAGGLAGAFWFFLPPLWWVLARMRLDHEFLADLRAASGSGRRGVCRVVARAVAAPSRRSRAGEPRPGARRGAGLGPLPAALDARPMPVPARDAPASVVALVVADGVALATLAASSLSYRGVEAAQPAGRVLPSPPRPAVLPDGTTGLPSPGQAPTAVPYEFHLALRCDVRVHPGSPGRPRLTLPDARGGPTPGHDPDPVERPGRPGDVALAPRVPGRTTHPHLDQWGALDR